MKRLFSLVDAPRKRRWFDVLSAEHRKALDAAVIILGDDAGEPEAAGEAAFAFAMLEGAELRGRVLEQLQAYNLRLEPGRLTVYCAPTAAAQALEKASRERRHARTFESHIRVGAAVPHERVCQVMAAHWDCSDARAETRAGRVHYIAEGLPAVLWSELREVEKELKDARVVCTFAAGALEVAVVLGS